MIDIEVKKPVIYIYPEKEMRITVELDLKNGDLKTIYPKFSRKNKWELIGKENGEIIIGNKIYPYLFWEASSYKPFNTEEGFIVSKENAKNFLEEKLGILGLKKKEITDFITYWLPAFEKINIHFVHFNSKIILITFN